MTQSREQRRYIHNYAVMVGIPWACVEDYLEEVGDGVPTVDGLRSYYEDVESDFYADVRWQAQCSSSPILASGQTPSQKASGFASLMSNIRMVG